MANTPESQFSRRTLAKGAAWAVPVVAAAVGAPAYAFSKLPAPTGPFRASLTACNEATVSWGEPTGFQYQVEYSVNGTDFKETTTVTGTSTTVTAGGTENIRAVQVRRYDSAEAYSDWVTIATPITGPTNFTFSATKVGSPPDQGYPFSWSDNPVLSGLGATYSVSGIAENNKDIVLGPTTELQLLSGDKAASATLTTNVCGLTFTAQWPVNGLLREPSPNNAGVDTAENTKVETPATEPQKQGKQPAESKAPAAKKSAPTVEPTPSPTPTPEPSVSMVPDPDPIVTESGVLPEPVPVPTPSA